MSSNTTQSTTYTSDEVYAMQLHAELNKNPSRNAGQTDRYGTRATAKEVNEAILDGQGSSPDPYLTNKGTQRKY